jgi:hypothetical protein
VNIDEFRPHSKAQNPSECDTFVEVKSLTLGRYGDELLKLNWAIEIKQKHVIIDIASYIDVQAHLGAFSYVANHVETKVLEGGLQCPDPKQPASGGILIRLHLHDGTVRQCQFEAPPLV